ncbi:hypothetical protein [Nannocystis punicea]|uniref:Lipoprotein n=1 Tax=Nannocystis punicea TaxID=2995304 RepID=A0ABY7HJG4_9BACT|nr:hypothetical protein [Nannocystis poenicansa]WAS99476.1 hypothetical protein O0S08_25405 [Nannocystis poenicansa]
MRIPAAPALSASAALLACTPEPASTVEMRQTVVEVVDQGRAMAIENAVVALVGTVDPDDELTDIADTVAAGVAMVTPCAAISRPGAVALRIWFGSKDTPCPYAGIGLSGTMRVVYTRPDGHGLLASIYYEPLRGDSTLLDGFSQLTWAADGSQRLVTEIRVDTTTERQVEIQSDRLLSRVDDALKVEGWRRWQTLMGRWDADLAALLLASDEFMPHEGLAAVQTPFGHTIVLDFTHEAGTPAQVRANGGRRDRLFEVTDEGDVIDAGDG